MFNSLDSSCDVRLPAIPEVDPMHIMTLDIFSSSILHAAFNLLCDP